METLLRKGSTTGGGVTPPTIPATVLDNGDMEEDSTASVRKDTVKPTKVDCPTNEVNRGILLTKIMDSLNKKQQTQEIRDSMTQWKYEAGYSIHWDTTNHDYIPVNYAKGDSNNVAITIYDPAYIIIGGLHDHPIGKDGYAPGPSPKDLYHLVNAYLYNPNYRHNFVLGADGTDWALSTGSNATLMQDFKNNYPPDSLLNDTEWSNDYKLPNAKDGLFDFWLKLTAMINDEFHYPIERSQTYANLLLMKYYLKTGVDLYIKDNEGKMHKLDILLQRDTNNNIIIQVQICN
jgi:hypothetical protein